MSASGAGGVWLARHGALPPNPERRMVGARDIPLSPLGRAQAAALGRELPPALARSLRAVICSDLRRCRESAALLMAAAVWPAGPPPLHPEPDLREICLGAWEGLTQAEIAARFPGAWEARGARMAGYAPPDGESFAQVQARALRALRRWRKRCPEGPLLLVSHAGVIRCLLAHYLALPLGELMRIPQHYACRVFLPEW
ncbi:histidine phosphatase family protein [Desulfovibrio legallii]|jgi:probable phosphoglycerate mutase|uniref:Probable phosphoglycerate mutase n=1 Tax=Desulfovibrio legallii TaxID=571438 RepID=A0A1G7MLU4_9BACT|nr:histidine phosphatase family protein [Desulfovibrio legallii]SDF62050.1 probable phosphoglycerate mutase [Desulfovibrio legallii]